MEDNSLFIFLFASMLLCYAIFSAINLVQYYKKKRLGAGDHIAIIHIRASLSNIVFCSWYFLIMCYAASSYFGDKSFWSAGFWSDFRKEFETDIRIDWIFYAPFIACVLLVLFKKIRSSPFTSIALVSLPVVGYITYIYVSNAIAN